MENNDLGRGGANLSQTRAPWAWVVLALIFGFLIVGELVVRKPLSVRNTLDSATLSTELKTTLLQRDFARSLGVDVRMLEATASSKLSLQKSRASLEKILAKASPTRSNDPVAAMFTLTVGRELGLSADKGALACLQSSKSVADRTYADIYSGAVLSSDWVSQHKSRLPKNFLGRVALAHATHADTAITPFDSLFFIGISMGALIVLMAGFAVIVSVSAGIAQKKIVPRGPAIKNIDPADADRLALRMCLFFFGFLLVPGLVASLLSGSLVTGAATLIGEVVFLIVFWWLCQLPVFGVSDPFKKLIGDTEKPFRLIGWGLAGFAANIPIVFAFAIVSHFLLPNAPNPSHPLSDQLGSGVSPVTLVILFAIAAVMAPVLEELSFRGLLFPALARFMRPGVAMVLSGFLFGAIHPQGPLLWASLASIGAVSAYLSYLTGSLVPSMVMHAVHNFCILTLSVSLLL